MPELFASACLVAVTAASRVGRNEAGCEIAWDERAIACARIAPAARGAEGEPVAGRDPDDDRREPARVDGSDGALGAITSSLRRQSCASKLNRHEGIIVDRPGVRHRRENAELLERVADDV